jgi:hypothetical protein
MAKLSVLKGATSVLCRVFFQDSSSATGAGLTGLTSGSSGLVCYRARDDDGNAGATQITLSAGTRGTWSSGGFVEKDSTNLPGVYEFGIPNAALATGSRSVLVMFKGATNLAPCPLEVELTGWDNQDGTRGGMTALPNAAAAASGGLPTVDSTNSVKIQTVHKKNTALNGFSWPMFLSGTNTLATGKTVTLLRSLDGGSFGAGTLGSVTEIGTTGNYQCNFGSGDRNGNVVLWQATATGCDTAEGSFLMEP